MRESFDNAMIGQRIKEMRIKNKLSLNKLAGKAGIAVSFLSKVESGKAALSVASLQKILGAFNVHIVEFFQSKSPHGDLSDRIIYKKHDMKVLQDPDRRWVFALPAHPGIRAMLTYEEYAPETKFLERESHPGEMCGYVLEGEFELEIVGRGVFKAKAGDAFYLKAGVEHVARNSGDKMLRMVVAIVKR